MTEDGLLNLTVEIVSAYVVKNPISQDELPDLILLVHLLLTSLASGEAAAPREPEPRSLR